jgi:hypothetical protein
MKKCPKGKCTLWLKHYNMCAMVNACIRINNKRTMDCYTPKKRRTK